MKLDRKLIAKARKKFPREKDRNYFHAIAEQNRRRARYLANPKDDAQMETIKMFEIDPNIFRGCLEKAKGICYKFMDSFFPLPRNYSERMSGKYSGINRDIVEFNERFTGRGGIDLV